MLSPSARPLLFAAAGHLVIELSNNFLPVVYPLLITSLGLNYSQIGALALVAGISTSLTQPLFGYLSDRWQAHLITIMSIAWNGAVMGLVGFAWDYPSLLLLVGVGSLGSAAFHPAGATMASVGGTERRGAAVSVFSVGGNVGSALSPVLVTAGITWLGMRGTSILVPVSLLVSFYLYRQLEPVQQSKTNPRAAPQTIAKSRSPVWLAPIVAAMSLRAWFQVALMTYLPTWAETQGRSLASGGRMLFVLLACVGIGSLIGGALSDRIGRWQVLALSLSLVGPAEWAFLRAAEPFQSVFLAATGVLVGSTFPVSIVLAQEIWPGSRGVASGLVIGLPWIGGGIGASFTGYVADRFSLTRGLQLLSIPALLAAACVLAYGVYQQSQSRV